MKKIFAFILSVCLLASLLSGCGSPSSGSTDATAGSSGSTGETAATSGTAASPDTSTGDDDMFTDRDLVQTYEESGSILIQLNGDSATASSDSVKISGTTITITQNTTHIITGTLNDGMIIVDAGKDAKLQLVLNGASITSQTCAALYILSADKVFVTLAEGTENLLANGGSFEAIDDNNIDGAIFSKQDLTLNGAGSLTVTSPAGHGIVCKDDLVITGGSYTVQSASHGLDANDSVRITGAALTVDAGKDAIHCENDEDSSLGFVYISGGTVHLEAEGDGVSAGAYLQITGGVVDVTAGGGSENGAQHSSDNYGGFMGGGMMGGGGRPGRSSSTETTDTTDEASTSMKGLKADGDILISGGTLTFNTADDAIHSNASVTINGGTFTIATGDDGVHSEDTLTITDCSMEITEAYEGLEAVYIYVRGGEFTMHCSDDGLNAAGGTDSSGTTGGRDGMFGGGMMGGMMGASGYGNIEISGGSLTIYSTGDALDSNGDLLISGGYVYATNPSSGDVSVLDSENAPVITGGTFIGLGISTSMAETFSSSSTQGVIACTCGSQSAGSSLTIANSSGQVVLDTVTEYTTVLLIISSPEIVKGESYTITIGAISGTVSAN